LTSKTHPDYCGDEFYRADAVEFLRGYLDGAAGPFWDYAAIHASPPCQRYSHMGQKYPTRKPNTRT
jgi:site-specific DNA-cytosine methylase